MSDVGVKVVTILCSDSSCTVDVARLDITQGCRNECRMNYTDYQLRVFFFFFLFVFFSFYINPKHHRVSHRAKKQRTSPYTG